MTKEKKPNHRLDSEKSLGRIATLGEKKEKLQMESDQRVREQNIELLRLPAEELVQEALKKFVESRITSTNGNYGRGTYEFQTALFLIELANYKSQNGNDIPDPFGAEDISPSV